MAQNAAAKLVGQPAHFSWGGLVATSLAAGVSGEIGNTPQQGQVGVFSGTSVRSGLSTVAAGAVQREVSRAFGDDHTASWKQIGEQAAGVTAGTALAGAFRSSSPTDDDGLEEHVNRLIGDESARVGADIEGSTEASLRGYSGMANLDGALSLRAYGLPGHTMTTSDSAAFAASPGMRSTFGNSPADSDISWPTGQDPFLLQGMSDARPRAFSLTAYDTQDFGTLEVHANPAGVVDEHYDPVYARQQAAMAGQRLALAAANQQRLDDFFNNGARHIVGAPVYAAVGLGKELANGAKWVGAKVFAGMEFQAARSAEFGAAFRGDRAGMDQALLLQNQALRDAAAPVAPVFQVSAFEHTAAQAFGFLGNPEELAAGGISLVNRLASRASTGSDVTASSYAVLGDGPQGDGVMVAIDRAQSAEQEMARLEHGVVDELGMARGGYPPSASAMVTREADLSAGGVPTVVYDHDTAVDLALGERRVLAQDRARDFDVELRVDASRERPELVGVAESLHTPEMFDIVSNNIVFNSGGDRLIDTMGSARTANSAELADIVSNLHAKGVDIRYSTNEFAYGPASSSGSPGNIVFDPDASISAIRHEYGHFLDDQALGFPGQRFYYENPQFRVATERSQYLGEIRTARQLGDTAARRMLIQDYANERRYLIDNYYFTPDGAKIPYGGPYGR